MHGETKIGTTHGLAGTVNGDTGFRRPEQVYVYATDDAVRPIAIEGWVGYNIDQRLELTKRQAKDLIPLLLEAVTR